MQVIDTKPLKWLGDRKQDMLSLSDELQGSLGYDLHLVQCGIAPTDFKPMTTVGKGVYELRGKDADGIARVMYIAKLPEAVYVLHVFQKKTRKTEKRDIDLAARRLGKLLEGRDNG